jgi:hypothetical protein
MAVVFDHPVRRRFRGRDLWTAHLVSDQAGIRGSRELVDVAKTLALRAAWLQHADTAFEHFDLLGAEAIERTRRSFLTREVDAEEISRICREKFRQGMAACLPAAVPPTHVIRAGGFAC